MDTPRTTEFLSDADYDILNAAALREFARLTQFLIPKNAVCDVDGFTDILVIDAPVDAVDAICNNSIKIAKLAYIKLGCNRVELYCAEELIETYTYVEMKDYNEIHQDVEKDIMIATATRPQVAAPSQQQEDAPISFEKLAQAMNVSQQEVESFARTQGIAQVQVDGQWGLSRRQVAAFATAYYDASAQRLMSALGDEPMSDDDFAESVVNIAADNNGAASEAPTVIEPISEGNGSVPQQGEEKGSKLTIMRFPTKTYEPATGRDIPKKYDMSLERALVSAQGQASNYCRRILDDTATETWMKKLLKSYPGDKNQLQRFKEAAQRRLDQEQSHS